MAMSESRTRRESEEVQRGATYDSEAVSDSLKVLPSSRISYKSRPGRAPC